MLSWQYKTSVSRGYGTPQATIFNLNDALTHISLGVTQGPSNVLMRRHMNDGSYDQFPYSFGINVICYSDDRRKRVFATTGAGYNIYVSLTAAPETFERGVLLKGTIISLLARTLHRELPSRGRTRTNSPSFEYPNDTSTSNDDSYSGVNQAQLFTTPQRRDQQLKQFCSASGFAFIQDTLPDTMFEYQGMKPDKAFQKIPIEQYLQPGTEITMVHRGAASEGCVLHLSVPVEPHIELPPNPLDGISSYDARYCSTSLDDMSLRVPAEMLRQNLALTRRKEIDPYVPDFITKGLKNPFRNINGDAIACLD